MLGQIGAANKVDPEVLGQIGAANKVDPEVLGQIGAANKVDPYQKQVQCVCLFACSGLTSLSTIFQSYHDSV